MKRKVVLFMLVVLLLAVLLPVVVAQEQEEVVLSIWNDGMVTIEPEQVAVIRAGWGACNKGLVRAYMNASYHEVLLDGESLLTSDQVDDLWGQVQPSPVSYEFCIQEPKPHFAEWRYVLADLPPGEHELRSTITVTHPVHDGNDYDGDGKPDMFTPDNFYRETVNTIIVLE
jgi:hypothetical protein